MPFFFKKIIQRAFQSGKNRLAGFSLIEMLVVVGIFTTVTAIVLANLPSFRDQSSLDLVAQEVAIQIRGAQTYAMSTLVEPDQERNVFGYALDFPAVVDGVVDSARQNFNLHIGEPVGEACDPTVGSIKETYQISGNFVIGNVCLGGQGIPYSVNNQTSYLGICFKRPNGQLWKTVNLANSPNYTVIVQSKTDPSKRRYVNVSNNGQIYVSPDTPLVNGCS